MTTPLDYRTVTDNGMDISHFFERPIKLFDKEWDDDATLFDSYSIWYQYFCRSTVRQKLRGFSRMVCEGLEIDFRVNGSPFRYGSVLVSYRPLFCRFKRIEQTEVDGIKRFYPVPYCDFSGGHILADGVSDPGTQTTESYNMAPDGGTTATLMARSQRQSVYLDVASSQGAKMVIPFVCPKESLQLDFCSLPNDAAFEKYANRSYFMRSLMGLGTLTMESLHQLRNLQASTTNGVTITAYARPLGVRAWMSSANASLDRQGITSLFSNLWTSRKESDVPIASNSQVTVLAPLQNGEKPTISDLARKSAIISLDPWTTTYSPGYSLLAIPIHPVHRVMSTYVASRSPNQLQFTMTPAAFVAMNYRMWRGTARVTMRVIATQFHKGRLRVTWEPDLVNYANTAIAANTSIQPFDPVSQSFIWDISTSSEVTFDIGFGSTTDRLNVPPLRSVGTPSTYSTMLGSASGFVTTDFSLDNFRDYINGFLMVHVENKLQAPSDCTVTIVTSLSFPELELYDAVSQTTCLDHMQDSTSATGMEYAQSTAFEEDLYTADYAPIPCMSTRPHTSVGLIPQGIGTVPKNLDSDTKIDHVFQKTTSVPCVDVMVGESLMDLVTREVLYDVHQFEVPMAQEFGSGTEAARKKLIGTYYPPYLIKGIMPVIPGQHGTTSPCTSMCYNRNAESVDMAYTATVGGATKSFTPNLARTHFAILLKECYVGYRSSFKWRFSSIGGNGMDCQYVSLERINAGPNKALGSSHTRNGSYPTLQAVSPYSNSPYIDITSVQANPTSLDPVNVVVKPLNYNVTTGTQVVDSDTNYDYPAWFTRFGVTTSGYSVASMQGLRQRMVTGLGSFFSGGAYGASGVQLHVPYFARTRFLPSSVLGWLFAESNQENSASLCLTIVTQAKCAFVNTVGYIYPAAVGDWCTYSHFPKHATVSLVSSVAPGDDYTVSHFVNVPNIYLLATPFYVTEKTVQ